MPSSDAVIQLRAGRAFAGVAPGIGGSIAHFYWLDGARRLDWLRPAGADDLAAGTADRLACFPLVPFSNRIRNGCFSFGGHDVALPLNQFPQPHAEHGHGWQAAWRVAARANDRLTLEYEHAADAWPFPYRAVQEFRLTEDALSVALTVENRGPGRCRRAWDCIRISRARRRAASRPWSTRCGRPTPR
jgi:aldose 1-epimerase